MSKLRTNEGYIGLGKQTSKGNPAAASAFFLRYQDGSFKPEQPTQTLKEGGDGQYNKEIIKLSHQEKFQFKALARPEMIAYLMAWFLGEDTLTGATDPYTHVITRGNSRLWFTIFRKITTSKVQRLEDCKITSITITGEAGKPVEVTVDGIACNATIQSSTESEVYEASDPFLFYHGSNGFQLGGVVNKDIKKFQIKFAISGAALLTDDLVPGDMPDLDYTVDVSLDKYADGTTEWQNSNYNGQTTPQADVYTNSLTIDLTYTESSKARELKIEVPSFHWQPIDLPVKAASEVATETIAGIALKTTGAELATVTVQNDLSSDLAGAGS